MSLSFTPHILPSVTAALVLLGLLVVAWRNRRDPAANRVRQTVESMRVGVGVHGDGIAVTLSMGVTQVDSDPSVPFDTLDTVLQRADRALYQAKDMGRNSVVTSDGETVPAASSLRVVV